jgi:hypothetical protein
MQVQLWSPLSFYLSYFNTRIYSHLSLAKLLECILTEAGMVKGEQFSIELQDDDTSLWMQQDNSKTLDFLYELMHTHGIHFIYQQSSDHACCLFSDKFIHLTPSQTATLDLKDISGLNTLHETSDVILENQLQTETHKYRSYRPETPDIQTQQHSDSHFASTGTVVKLSDSTCNKKPLEGELLVRRSGNLTFSTDALTLSPGQRVKVNVLPSTSSSYVVQSIILKGKIEDISGSIPVKNHKEPQKLRLKVDMVLGTYLPCLSSGESKPCQLFHSALIEHPKSIYPELSKTGAYQIRLQHDNAIGEKQYFNEKNKASLYVRNALYFSGNNYGLSAPFEDSSEVLIGYENGLKHKPIILGALPNHQAYSVVTDINKSDNKIVTRSGSAFTISSNAHESTVSLTDLYYKQSIRLLQKTKAAQMLVKSADGVLQVDAQKKFSWAVKDVYKQITSSSQRIWVGQDTTITNQKGPANIVSDALISCKSTKDININGRTLNVQANRAHQISALKHIKIDVNALTNIHSLQGLQTWHIDKGEVYLSARYNMEFKVGPSRMCVNKISVCISTPGIISINAGETGGI